MNVIWCCEGALPRLSPREMQLGHQCEEHHFTLCLLHSGPSAQTRCNPRALSKYTCCSTRSCEYMSRLAIYLVGKLKTAPHVLFQSMVQSVVGCGSLKYGAVAARKLNGTTLCTLIPNHGYLVLNAHHLALELKRTRR